jgi:hypothetical protein
MAGLIGQLADKMIDAPKPSKDDKRLKDPYREMTPSYDYDALTM